MPLRFPPIFSTDNRVAVSLANMIAAHLCAMRNREDSAFIADLPLALVVSDALCTDIWRCRHDGMAPPTADAAARSADRRAKYDSEFFLALGEAVTLLDMTPMYVVRISIFRPDVTTAYEILTEHLPAPSLCLMHVLRGAFEEHRFGHAG